MSAQLTHIHDAARLRAWCFRYSKNVGAPSVVDAMGVGAGAGGIVDQPAQKMREVSAGGESTDRWDRSDGVVGVDDDFNRRTRIRRGRGG